MKTLLPILAIFICASALAEKRSDEKWKIETQIETGFSLTETAARRILRKFKFEPESRVDYYVDIYDGRRFWLDGSDESHKLRLKLKDKKGVLQAKSLEDSYPQSCFAPASFDVKKKTVGELKLGEVEANRFVRLMTDHLNSVEASNTARAILDLRRFHDLVMGSETPRLDVFMYVPDVPRWYFVGSHIARKVKWWTSVDEGLGPFRISITEAKDFIGSNFWQDRYEIEFQLKEITDMSTDDFALSVCRWMSKMSFKGEDFQPIRRDPQEESLRKLRRLNDALGFVDGAKVDQGGFSSTP